MVDVTTSPYLRINIPMQQELWFSSTECPRDEEKPLLRLGSLSSKTNISPMQTRLGPRSRKPSKQHLSSMTQPHKLESPLLHSTRTRRTPQDLTSTSPPSPSSQSAPESPTTMLYRSGSFEDLTHKLQYNSLSWEQSKSPPLWRNFTQRPPRSEKVTATSHHLEEDPSHPMEKVVITTNPML